MPIYINSLDELSNLRGMVKESSGMWSISSSTICGWVLLLMESSGYMQAGVGTWTS